MGAEIVGHSDSLYVTYAAAQAFARHTGAEPEEARRRLTELLLDAVRKGESGTGAEQYRWRSRAENLDITAQVSREGRLAVVVHVHVRPRE